MTNQEKIETLRMLDIPVKNDSCGFLVKDGWYDIFDSLKKHGFKYVEKDFDDDTIGFYSDGEYKITIIAANPTVIDIETLDEYEE